MGKAKIWGGLALALVLLRLAAGWHFYSEGIKKLEPGFSSAGFLRSAKGPLAPYFKQFAPGPYNFDGLVAQPQQIGSSTEKASAAWAEQIAADWQTQFDQAVEAVSASEDLQKKLDATRKARLDELTSYLDSVESDIADYRHELWRLEQLHKKDPAGTLAYNRDRVEAKQAETWGTPRSWQATVQKLHDALADDYETLLQEQAEPSSSQMEAVEAALHPQTPLDFVNKAVTWTVIGVGVCLLLGFATRIAALAGAGFLLSVIATQPPWVPGAETGYFFYQVVEVFALLVLAMAGAGRWLGFDAVLGACWGACCGSRNDED